MALLCKHFHYVFQSSPWFILIAVTFPVEPLDWLFGPDQLGPDPVKSLCDVTVAGMKRGSLEVYLV